MQSVICRACACHALRVRAVVRASGSRAGAGPESPLKRLVQDATSFGEAAPVEHELQWATQPYATGAAELEREPRARPEETSVLLFPGEGAEFVGMSRRLQDVPAARDLYELASSIVGWDVGRVCREGPADELQRRAHTALLVTSLGALEAARERRPAALERARAAAGFSLGEFAALVYAGVLPFDQTVRLVELRALALQAAAAERACGQLTVWLAADARLGALLAAARAHGAAHGLSAPVCQVSQYLFPGCKVLAGDQEALRFVEERGREWGVRRSERTAGGAAHSALAARVQDVVREALRSVDVRAPALQVISCLDARPYPRGSGAAGEARRRLARLSTAPARWEQALHALFARPRGLPQPLALALGPHQHTRATLRRVNARAWDTCVHIDV